MSGTAGDLVQAVILPRIVILPAYQKLEDHLLDLVYERFLGSTLTEEEQEAFFTCFFRNIVKNANCTDNAFSRDKFPQNNLPAR